MNWHSLKLGDLIRGTYPHDDFNRKRSWLGIITDRESDWLEITWDDGDIEQYDLGNMDNTQEMIDHWEAVNESR